MSKIKVLVADSSEIYAMGLARSLSGDDSIEVFNNTYKSRQIIDSIRRNKPDIALIGLELLSGKGSGICKGIREEFPEVKVMVIVPDENMTSLFSEVIDIGARGILPRNISPAELLGSVIEMTTLGVTMHSTLVPQMLEMLQGGQKKSAETEAQISAREREVLELVAKGKNNREIAEILFISVNTVKCHIRRISNKLNIYNRVEMARYVLLDSAK